VEVSDKLRTCRQQVGDASRGSDAGETGLVEFGLIVQLFGVVPRGFQGGYDVSDVSEMASSVSAAVSATEKTADGVEAADDEDDDAVAGCHGDGVVMVESVSPMIRRIMRYAVTPLSLATCTAVSSSNRNMYYAQTVRPNHRALGKWPKRAGSHNFGDIIPTSSFWFFRTHFHRWILCLHDTCCRRLSVCPSVRHTPVLCQNG